MSRNTPFFVQIIKLVSTLSDLFVEVAHDNVPPPPFFDQIMKWVSALSELVFVDVAVSNVGVTLVAENFPDVFVDLRLDNIRQKVLIHTKGQVKSSSQCYHEC